MADENNNPLKVIFTVDTEVWCNGWQNIDAKFADAFRRYIYGPTTRGDYGLPFQLKVLRDHGLRGVFFVEALFATRFGLAPLEEVVGLIVEADQAVELHLHTEWVDEARIPIFRNQSGKRQHIRYFSFEEQTVLLHKGMELLVSAGANTLNAFRAGSFGANNDTLRALAETSIRIDSSFNSVAIPCAIKATKPIRQPVMLGGVLEVPVAVFRDGIGKLRPAQLTACSFSEMKAVLDQAHQLGWDHFVILTHPFELLNPSMTRRNGVVVRRFLKLCDYLATNRDRFVTTNFSSTVSACSGESHPLRCTTPPTIGRLAEQVWSRLQ